MRADQQCPLAHSPPDAGTFGGVAEPASVIPYAELDSVRVCTVESDVEAAGVGVPGDVGDTFLSHAIHDQFGVLSEVGRSASKDRCTVSPV